jgi:hypothetical protein
MPRKSSLKMSFTSPVVDKPSALDDNDDVSIGSQTYSGVMTRSRRKKELNGSFESLGSSTKSGRTPSKRLSYSSAISSLNESTDKEDENYDFSSLTQVNRESIMSDIGENTSTKSMYDEGISDKTYLKKLAPDVHPPEDVFLWQYSATFTAFCLCNSIDLPDWHFQHRQLHYGYRKCANFWEAFQSLFYFHNEFVNIWLHYLGSFLLFYKTYQYYIQYSTESPLFSNSSTSTMVYDEYSPDFKVIFVSIIMGNCFPILTSALCHHFYCVSPAVHKFCWFLDFIGMLSGITFVSFNFLYVTFYCSHHPSHDPTTLQHIAAAGGSLTDDVDPIVSPSIFTTIVVLLVGGYLTAAYMCWQKYTQRVSQIALIPKDRFPEFSKILSLYSGYTFIVTIFSSTYFHTPYLNHPVLSSILIQSCLYPVAMAMGIVVFAQGSIPERFTSHLGLPKHFFDLFGHSHQLWHIVSFTVLYFWIDVIFDHYNTRHGMTCPLLS